MLSGYNYGLPNVSTKPPGGATNATGKSVERIKVCVRKRPLLAREVKQAEVDIVDMKDAHIVSVEEMKLAVDLTKFLQKVSVIVSLVRVNNIESNIPENSTLIEMNCSLSSFHLKAMLLL